MVNEAEIAKWVRSLSENERLILATYEGNNCMPEIMERYWNARALESLILQGIIEWTIPGYKLSEDGVLLAQYIDNLEKTANRFTGTTGNNSINDSAKKNSRKRMKFGEPCPKCGAEVVKITRDTLNKIKTLTTKFHSVSKSRIAGKQAYIPICPECDAYALGIEFETGFPFILKNGQESEIQQIADMLWQPDKPFRSKNLENIKSDSEADVARNSSIIPFPRYSVPTIDWDEIERIRVERYPELPPEIIEVLKPLMASTPASSDRYSFQINSDSDEMYPPDPIPLIPGKACAIWMMDLVDRFGGMVSYNDLSCAFEREKSKLPVYLIQRITNEQFSAINDCLLEYEFMIQNKHWRIISKNITGFELVMLFAEDLTDESRIFMGLFDPHTFEILKERLSEGKQFWDEILLIN